MKAKAMDGDIVENFLMKKLNEEISKADKDWEKKPKCKSLPAPEEWKALKNLLKQKKPETGAAVRDTRREKLYHLLNLFTEWNELWNRQQLAPQADKLTPKLKKVKKDLEEAPLQREAQQSPNEFPEVYRWSSHANLAKIHGFDDKLKIMERLLLNNVGSNAIGIVGVAGVGKTALCQLAYRYEPVRQQFLLRIWLCLSKPQKIDDDHARAKGVLSCLGFEGQVRKMLSCLGFEDQVIDKVGGKKLLELALRRQLNRRRYLVVLDDVWTIHKDDEKVAEEDRSMVAEEDRSIVAEEDRSIVAEEDRRIVAEEDRRLFSFLTKYQGTVIVTGRSPRLEKMVGARNVHRLLPLADYDDSCWKIFKDAFMEDGSALDDTMEKMKDSIVNKCDGLPLMAKMLGKIRHAPPSTLKG